MVSRSIELTDEQDRQLEEFAAEAGSSDQELRRRAVALSGRFRSGLGDLATEHDRYLEDSFQA